MIFYTKKQIKLVLAKKCIGTDYYHNLFFNDFFLQFVLNKIYDGRGNETGCLHVCTHPVIVLVTLTTIFKFLISISLQL